VDCAGERAGGRRRKKTGRRHARCAPARGVLRLAHCDVIVGAAGPGLYAKRRCSACGARTRFRNAVRASPDAFPGQPRRLRQGLRLGDVARWIHLSYSARESGVRHTRSSRKEDIRPSPCARPEQAAPAKCMCGQPNCVRRCTRRQRGLPLAFLRMHVCALHSRFLTQHRGTQHDTSRPTQTPSTPVGCSVRLTGAVNARRVRFV
jgi:hypothetical protein